MDIAKFKRLPVMGIMRGIEADILESLIEAVVSAGLETIEIAMNTEGAEGLIKSAVKISKGRLTVGAGTVLDSESLNRALDAGATFIVSPVLIEEVIGYCVDKKVPAFPGALTPQEVYSAWKAGATMVKVFPSGFFGPAYFKELKGPFNDIELLACGGVTPQNMRAYFDSGASAIAFGASVFKNEWLAQKDFGSIKESIKEFAACKNFLR